MNTFMLIAWRNLWRNKRRTLITVSAITFSVAITLIMIAMNDGSHDKMFENTMNIFTGYIQIHREGFEEDPGLEKSFVLTPEILKAIRQNKNISSYTPRLQTGALAASKTNSTAAFVVGIEPEKEANVTIFDDRIVKGEYLSQDGKLECLIGERMAKNLQLKTGSKMVLLTQGRDGSMGALKFTVRGIFRVGSMDMDRSMVLVNLEDARDLLMASGMVNSIAIKTDSPDEIYNVVSVLKSNLSGKGYEVLGWKELMPELVQFINMDNIKDSIFLGLLMLVVIFGVLSAVFSSVLERTNEFGLMLALGTRPYQVVLLVIMEALCLTLAGLAGGLAIGLGYSIWGVFNPISLPSSSAQIMEHFGMENKIFFAIKPIRMIGSILFILILSLLFSIYPAWRASRLRPDQALRNIDR